MEHEDKPMTTEPANHEGNDTAQEGGRLSRIVSIPNVLSLSRLLVLPVILLMLQSRQMIPALALMLLSWITDALDGYYARKLHQVTTLGKILDHLVDKIWVGTILVMLVAIRGLPAYLAWAVIGRDLLIVAGSLMLLDRRREIVSSNVIGKITGSFFATLMLLYVVDNGYEWLQLPKRIVTWIVSGMIVVSLANYVVVYVRHMARRRAAAEQDET